MAKAKHKHVPKVSMNEPDGKESRNILLDILLVKIPVYRHNVTKTHRSILFDKGLQKRFLVSMIPKTVWLITLTNSSINGNITDYLLNIYGVKLQERIKIYKIGHK